MILENDLIFKNGLYTSNIWIINHDKMASIISEDVLRKIAMYLPYNDRINFNLALPLNYRYVKKLDSDNHNLAVKVDLMRKKLLDIEKFPGDSRNRIRAIKRLYTYMLHTKDTCLFTKANTKFYNMARDKSNYFADPANYTDYIHLKYRREINSLIKVCQQLASRIDTIGPPSSPGRCILIQIK